MVCLSTLCLSIYLYNIQNIERVLYVFRIDFFFSVSSVFFDFFFFFQTENGIRDVAVTGVQTCALPIFAGKEDYIILDADSHASIYDGCALGNAQIVRFRHNNVEDLDKRLGRLPAEGGRLVVLEGVYSMLGDIAPLKEMVAVAKKHGAMIAVDEAHGMGFFGEHGRGVFEEAGVEDDVDFVIGTFSKSVGTVGGFIVSNHTKFEVLRLVCRPYVFTASLPPSVVATAATSIRKLMHAGDKRAHLWENSKRLHKGLRDRKSTRL